MKKNLAAVENLSSKAMKSLEQVKDRIEMGYVTRDTFTLELEKLKKNHEDSIIAMPKFIEKNTVSLTAESEQRFAQMELKI